MSRLDELRTDQVRNGDGVVDRRAVPAVGLVVIAGEVHVEVGDDAADAPGSTQPLLDVAAQERLCVTSRPIMVTSRSLRTPQLPPPGRTRC